MKIKILEEIIEIENEQYEIEKVFDNINEIITKSGLNLTEIKIDGIDFYENYNEYIMSNLENIQIIEINLKTTKEIINENLETIISYLERIFPELDLLVDDIYIEFSKELWEKFSQIFDGLEFILKILDILLKNKELYDEVDKYSFIKQEIETEIKHLSEAFEIDDRVYISDIIIYEIKFTLEKLYKEICITLNM